MYFITQRLIDNHQFFFGFYFQVVAFLIIIKTQDILVLDCALGRIGGSSDKVVQEKLTVFIPSIS